MFARLGLWCHDRRRLVLALWIVVLLLANGIASGVGEAYHQDIRLQGAESTEGFDTLDAAFGGEGAGQVGTIVFRAEQGVDNPEVRAAMEALFAEVAQLEDVTRVESPYAEGGDLQVITLYDGQRFEGIPGERKFRIVRFAENTIPVRLPALSGGAVALEGAPTRTLLQSPKPEQVAEFHWRIAFPIMALVLAGIAVPLARLRPRQGRYARIGYAVLIFFVYINLAIAGRQGLARGAIPQWLGLWWVHAAVVLLALAILLLPRWNARRRYRRNTRAMTAAVPA